MKASFDCIVFDLDGVVTQTTKAHSAAWKEKFDEFLRKNAQATNTPFVEFRHHEDYLPLVDGKPSYNGV